MPFFRLTGTAFEGHVPFLVARARRVYPEFELRPTEIVGVGVVGIEMTSHAAVLEDADLHPLRAYVKIESVHLER